ncbi:TPA: site-specific integrase [Pseudomonas aeruginosa]|nr:recombinase XerD [Pseudomonas aeruginosa]TEC20843.1 site-specific integrase [Pseudomonas aeruginosa]HBO1343766.1 site-specific integrase [Pseudomonas aeruginosa]HBO1588654.1 site-specific integrase [Pseudomonas aeruginosa]HBO1968242.1 site-specific integrase [Pseudomonas aeruginosa]
MKVKRYQFNSLPFVSIVDDVDCPIDPYVSCYLNGQLSAKSANTRLRYANELLFMLQYFLEKNIDLPARVESGQFISHREYMQFYDRCCLSKSINDESLNIKFLDINDKQLRNIIVANQKGMAKVSNETLQGRVRRLRKFLLWLFDQFHEVQDVDKKTNKKFNGLIHKIKLDEDALGKNGTQQVGDPEESVIPDDVFVKFLEMLIPSSPNNPFKASKVRNYLIVNLLVQGGIRRGALAKLKVSDFLFWGGYDQISIYRSGNDPTDPRAEKPDQKTKAHFATVDPSLMKKVEFYIDNIRAVFPRAKFHDFVFVSENDSKGTAGQPLSLKAINAIFQKLSRALGFHVHPHLLRHKWNEIFDKKGELLGVNPALLEDCRKYAMGWSHNSDQSDNYNEKRIALKAREISKAHQHRVDQKK